MKLILTETLDGPDRPRSRIWAMGENAQWFISTQKTVSMKYPQSVGPLWHLRITGDIGRELNDRQIRWLIRRLIPYGTAMEIAFECMNPKANTFGIVLTEIAPHETKYWLN